MFDNLPYTEFKQLAKQHRRIALYQSIPGDTLTPTNAYLALQSTEKQLSLLESNPKTTHNARYSYLFFNPILSIEARQQQVSILTETGLEHVTSDPFTLLEDYRQQYQTHVTHPLAHFAGGFIGFMSYDSVRLIEAISDRHPDEHNIPDLQFKVYQDHVTFDHQTGNVLISTIADTQAHDSFEKIYQDASMRLKKLHECLLQYTPKKQEKLNLNTSKSSTVIPDISDEAFCEKVNLAKKRIIEGDIFQVVLSRNFKLPITSNAFDIYRALRFSNPSPYMFYFESEEYTIAGASPEKLISIQDGVIESCPLAGTRPRDKTQDESLAADLLGDEKEVAEHMMLVDLARNDLGQVAKAGTVKVTKLKVIEKYERVMHIASTVQAKLDPHYTVFDALKASFPAGTLSGAPKISAMNIIDELETSKRGIYGGVICAIDSFGNLETCIAIRTAFIKDKIASVRAGAGIVFDSDPQKEANETYHKARAILEGIQLAQGESA